MAGPRQFKNRDAHEYLDEVVCSDRDKHALQRMVATDDQRWAQMATDQYGETTSRATRDLDSVLRIFESGKEAVEGILEDLRNGEITATEAAKAIGAARKDLNRLRSITSDAVTAEERTWAEVDCDPATYQEQLMNRAPALFRNGRNLVVLPTFD